MASLFATQRERYAEAALSLWEASDAAESDEQALVYSRAWASAFTASRHMLLAERNTDAAHAVRVTANFAASRRRRAISDAAMERAKELDGIAQRHRAAAEKAANRAVELEDEARNGPSEQKAQPAAAPPQRGGRPLPRNGVQRPQPPQRPPAQPPQRAQAQPQRPAPPAQPQQRPPQPIQRPAPAAVGPQSATGPAAAVPTAVQPQAERPQPSPTAPPPYRGGDDGDGGDE